MVRSWPALCLVIGCGDNIAAPPVAIASGTLQLDNGASLTIARGLPTAHVTIRLWTP